MITGLMEPFETALLPVNADAEYLAGIERYVQSIGSKGKD